MSRTYYSIGYEKSVYPWSLCNIKASSSKSIHDGF